MDPLSEVLDLLDLRAALPSRLEAGGSWALSFTGHRHLKVGAVLAGACWLIPEGAGPLRLTAGDCYLLSSSRPFTVASDLETVPVPSSIALPGPWPIPAYYQAVPDDPARTILISGALSFDDTAAEFLLHSLPPAARLGAGSHQAATLTPILELLGDETAAAAPGSATMRRQLTHILFIQVLRALLTADEQAHGATLGWLAALSDERVGAALSLMHEQPARRWTVAELAAAVSMSRSSFAVRFKTLVGLPPLDYLVRWRMQIAARALRFTDQTVAAIGAGLGYPSESAFSNTFKRVLGQPPARYRHPQPDARAIHEAAALSIPGT
jgi:AraC-like DNA-binding protein